MTYFGIFMICCPAKKAFSNSRSLEDAVEPMSYGTGEEPHPTCLMFRGRLSLFASEKEAKTALNKSAGYWSDQSWTFHKKKLFRFIPCEVTP